MTRTRRINEYLDRCEADNWAGRDQLDGETIFPFQEPIPDTVAKLSELCGRGGLPIMIASLDSWLSHAMRAEKWDPDRELHIRSFNVMLYDCIGNLFGQIPPSDDRYEAWLVEEGRLRGWNQSPPLADE
jgi:hypothetical protein